MVIFLNRKNSISEYFDPYRDTIRYSVAGIASGAGGVFVGQPFDLIKVLMQTQRTKYPNAFSALRSVVKEGGVRSLYRGTIPPLIGAMAVNGFCFGIYGTSLGHIKRAFGREKETLGDIALAGVFAGTINNFFQVPGDLIKTKLQLGIYPGLGSCVKDIVKNQGYSGLMKGFSITWIRDAPSFAIYFASFEYLHDRWGNSAVALLNAGGIAGILSWLSTYPADIVKSRIQSLPVYPHPGWDKYTGIIDCAVKSYRSEGGRVFFRGLGVCLTRAYPVNAAVLYLYETVSKWMKRVD